MGGIVAIGNQKGGPWKTTLSVNLAVTWAKACCISMWRAATVTA